MKLLDIFESEEINNERVFVSLDSDRFNGLIRANHTAAFILECLKDDITEQDLIYNVCHKYGITLGKATEDVKGVLDELRSLSLLVE
jgi:hypothetical protein